MGWAVATSCRWFRDRMGDWARDLDETRDKGLSPLDRQRRRRKVIRSRTKEGLHRTVVELDDQADAVFYGAVRDAAAGMQRADRKAQLPPDSSAASVSSWPTPRWRWPAAPGAPM